MRRLRMRAGARRRPRTALGPTILMFSTSAPVLRFAFSATCSAVSASMLDPPFFFADRREVACWRTSSGTVATICAMAGHMLGMAQMVATVPELVRQQATSLRSAKKNGGSSIDALTALQVAENAKLSTGALVENMRMVGPRAVRGRRRAPALILNRRIPQAQDVGGQSEWWTLSL